MGKFSRRLVAVLVALIMVMASAMAVFAADTPSAEEGDKAPSIVNLGTNDSFLNKTFRFKWRGKDAKTYKAFMRQKNGKWTSKDTTNQYYEWKGLKTGGLYQFKAEAWNGSKKASSTISYRWMQSCKASATGNKGSFTVKWGKVSGAQKYQIQYSRNKSMSGAKYAYPGGSETSKKITAAKGTWYYRIRPVQGSYVGIYNGIQSVTVK